MTVRRPAINGNNEVTTDRWTNICGSRQREVGRMAGRKEIHEVKVYT
jgi:hypothetical protein